MAADGFFRRNRPPNTLTALAILAAMLAWVTAAFAVIGVVQQFVGTILVARFAAVEPPPPADPPPVSVLKPLCGVEPLTELALESFFLLDYPVQQLVFGVQDEADPVLDVVAALQERYPGRDVAVVVSPLLHGSNRKISNLINMMPAVKYDTLVMSDADNHVPPQFLNRVVAALLEPNVGLVTTIYTAIPGTPHLATAMGANQINYNFLPGALLARALGRQDCLGVTMALTRQTLAAVGGLIAVANHLADDQVLGRLVRARGQALTLAQVVPATTVPEADFRALFHHELRWARTIRALVPLPYATSALQFSLVWAALAILFSAGAWPTLLLFPVVLLSRYVLARRIDATLRLAKSGDAWLFLLRDLVSAIIFVASYCGNRVDWRGQVMHADAGRSPRKPDDAPQLSPAKTLHEVE